MEMFYMYVSLLKIQIYYFLTVIDTVDKVHSTINGESGKTNDATASKSLESKISQQQSDVRDAEKIANVSLEKQDSPQDASRKDQQSWGFLTENASTRGMTPPLITISKVNDDNRPTGTEKSELDSKTNDDIDKLHDGVKEVELVCPEKAGKKDNANDITNQTVKQDNENAHTQPNNNLPDNITVEPAKSSIESGVKSEINASNKQHSFYSQQTNDHAVAMDTSSPNRNTDSEKSHRDEEQEQTKQQEPNLKSQTDSGGLLKVPKTLERSHSTYFTGRLPTLDPFDTPRIDSLQDQEKKLQADESMTEKERLLANNGLGIEFESESMQNSTTSKKGETGLKQDNMNAKSPSPKKDNYNEIESEPQHSSVNFISQEVKKVKDQGEISVLRKEIPISPITPEGSSKTEKQETPQRLESKPDGDEWTKLTVSDLNTVTTGIMIKDHEASSTAKYDDLPHMKKIIQYNEENHINEKEEVFNENEKHPDNNRNKENVDTKFTRTVTDISNDIDLEKPNAEQDGRNSVNAEIEQTALANRANNDNKLEKQHTTHSEKGLREMIASAKRAYGEDDTTTDLTSEINTSANTSGNVWRTDESSTAVTFDGLICSNCLCIDTEFTTSGFCHECQEYLCGKCRQLHKKTSATMHHHIMDSYCTNELKVKKYVRATGYCSDCEIFLCGKCTVSHTGHRAFRRHKIIQSSFISRTGHPTSDSGSMKPSNIAQIEDTEDKGKHDKERKEKSAVKKRKKYQHDFDTNNPYSINSANISESLYPGPNKKLALSYTSNPHWPLSSIPSLPYLVQPGTLHQRALNTPYLNAHQTPFYTQTRNAFEANTMKMRALQARYKPDREKRTARRKEASLFTARPLKNADGVSLPDITSARSHNVSGSYSHFDRHSNTKHKVLKKPVNQSNKLKSADFVRDQCLSIPFPSNELPCLISGMEILLDGRLVVLDKRNNNIKLYTRKFVCKAALQFQNRLVDMCASNIYPTDIYVATPKNLYEVSVQKGMEIVRKMKLEIKRIEGLVCWKYGLAVISMKTNLSWELRLLDFRGNLKSKLEILNPFTCEIEKSIRYHVVPTRGGKFVTIADNKNACVICVDVTTRCIVSETMTSDRKHPSYLTSDHHGNVYVSCGDEVQQVSAKGRNLGVVVKLQGDNNRRNGCIVYNMTNDRLYVQTKADVISIYEINV